MERRENDLPIAERLLQEPEYAVLNNLVSTRGQNPIAEIGTTILTEGGIVIISGEAGGGKTTSGSQFRNYLHRLANELGENIESTSLTFDEAYSKKERETGLNRYDWNKDTWQELNHEIAERTFKLHPTDKTHEKKFYTQVEIPLAGKVLEEELSPPDFPNYIDRGVTSTQLSIEKAKEQGINIFVVYFAPDPALQMSSGYLRVRIPEIPNSGLFDYLASHHIFFKDFDPKLYSPEELDQIGGKLKSTYRKMAQSRHMQLARNYEKAAEYIYQTEKPEDYENRKKLISPYIKFNSASIKQVADEFGLHDEVLHQSLLHGYRDKVIDMLAYDDYKIGSLDLPSNRGVVVQNPWQSNIKIYANLADFIDYNLDKEN